MSGNVRHRERFPGAVCRHPAAIGPVATVQTLIDKQEFGQKYHAPRPIEPQIFGEKAIGAVFTFSHLSP